MLPSCKYALFKTEFYTGCFPNFTIESLFLQCIKLKEARCVHYAPFLGAWIEKEIDEKMDEKELEKNKIHRSL
jgi:hypothetical protein